MQELGNRAPNYGVPERIEDTLDLDLVENTKEYEEMKQMVENFYKYDRRQRRKIIKPSFSKNVQEVYRKRNLE